MENRPSQRDLTIRFQDPKALQIKEVLRVEGFSGLDQINSSAVNGVIVQCPFSSALESVAAEIRTSLDRPISFALGREDDPEIAAAILDAELDLKDFGAKEFYQTLVQLVRGFQKVIRSDELGLRIEKVESDNCSNFHVDYVPLRLVTTLAGPGTQWLRNENVDRQALADRRFGEINMSSSIKNGADKNGPEGLGVEQVATGEVFLMKGELYTHFCGQSNRGAALVHKSPPRASFNEPRLLLRMDEIQERQPLHIGRR